MVAKTTTDNLLTVAQAAERLAVSPVTVRRLLDDGSLRRVRIGRAIRVCPGSLARLVSKGSTEEGRYVR